MILSWIVFSYFSGCPKSRRKQRIVVNITYNWLYIMNMFNIFLQKAVLFNLFKKLESYRFASCDPYRFGYRLSVLYKHSFSLDSLPRFSKIQLATGDKNNYSMFSYLCVTVTYLWKSWWYHFHQSFYSDPVKKDCIF